MGVGLLELVGGPVNDELAELLDACAPLERAGKRWALVLRDSSRSVASTSRDATVSAGNDSRRLSSNTCSSRPRASIRSGFHSNPIDAPAERPVVQLIAAVQGQLKVIVGQDVVHRNVGDFNRSRCPSRAMSTASEMGIRAWGSGGAGRVRKAIGMGSTLVGGRRNEAGRRGCPARRSPLAVVRHRFPRRLTKLVRVLVPGLLGGVGGRVCGILSDLLSRARRHPRRPRSPARAHGWRQGRSAPPRRGFPAAAIQPRTLRQRRRSPAQAGFPERSPITRLEPS